MNNEESIIKLLLVNQSLINIVLTRLGINEEDVIKIVNKVYEEVDLQTAKKLKGESNE